MWFFEIIFLSKIELFDVGVNEIVRLLSKTRDDSNVIVFDAGPTDGL